MADEALSELGRVFCEVLMASLKTQQASTDLERGALLVTVRGAPLCWTLLFGQQQQHALLEDDHTPPGTPRAELALTPDAVRTLGRGGAIGPLAQRDELAVKGDKRVLHALAEAFKPSASPLGVRIGSLKGRR